jgi:hypothetical protein
MTIATPIKPADELQRMADVLARQKAAHIATGRPAQRSASDASTAASACWSPTTPRSSVH